MPRALRRRRACTTPTPSAASTPSQDLHVAAPFADGAVPVDWDSAEPADASARGSGRPRRPDPHCVAIGPLPPAALDAEALRRLDQGLRAVGAARRAADALRGAGAQADVAARARASATSACACSQAARESRDAAVREAARPATRPRWRGSTQRLQISRSEAVAREAAAGVAAEDADHGVVRRDGARRAVRPQGGVAVHAGPRHHRGARRRPLGQGDRRTSPARRSVSRRQSELKALEAELQEEIAALGAPTSTSRSTRSRSSRSAAAWTCGWSRWPGSPFNSARS